MLAITGRPSGAVDGVARVLDVALALYAVAFFATSAGIVGAFFLEGRDQRADAAPAASSSTTTPR
jgi:voltage-gated potassium channel